MTTSASTTKTTRIERLREVAVLLVSGPFIALGLLLLFIGLKMRGRALTVSSRFRDEVQRT